MEGLVNSFYVKLLASLSLAIYPEALPIFPSVRMALPGGEPSGGYRVTVHSVNCVGLGGLQF